MKILIIGLPYFTKILQEKLQKFDPKNKYLRFNTYYNKVDKAKFLIHLINSDIIYSLNGTVRGSKAIDMALQLNKKVILHWQGSDVINATKAISSKKYDQKYLTIPKHLCVADWLCKELQSIGIMADYQPIVTINSKQKDTIPLPETFSILTYIPKNRPNFYGLNEIISIARYFPDIEIKVAGLDEYNKVPIPNNITFLGWVENMDYLYENSVLCLRLTKHDGLPFFVLEALNKYRYIGFSQNFKPCTYITNTENLINFVGEMYKKFLEGKLKENIEGHNFVIKHFDEQKILKKLIEQIIE